MNVPAKFWVVSAAMIVLISPLELVAESRWRSFQNAGDMQLDENSLPSKWSPMENIAWTAKIDGYGQSSPIVDSEQVVVTSTDGANKERCHLAAFALRSGERLWQKTFANPSPEKNNNYVSRAAPTPIADRLGYIAFYEGGLVVAVKRDGRPRWQRDLVEDYGAISARHGLASSLEHNEQHVFVWVERGTDPYLLALDKTTGETVWKSAGLGATSWSSPRLVPTPDGYHLVCSAIGVIAGFSPSTGARLWELTDISNNSTCTPMPVGDGRFLIGASDGRGESSGNAAASNGLIKISKQGDGSFQAKFVWQSKKASSSFGSPVVAGEKACFVNRAGVLFQLDLKTGRQLSTTRIASGSVWATPLAVGDRLYLFGYKGITSVLSLSDGSKLAENRVWDEENAGEAGARSPFGGGHVLYAAIPAPPFLILRRGDMLYAVSED